MLFTEQDYHKLFNNLYAAKTEDDVSDVIKKYPDFFLQENWVPIGGNDSNYGIIENQQSNPIAALVEKVANSMDAILTKKCLEQGIQPTSYESPRSMNEAVNLFFPDHKNWDITSPRRSQAENIQVIADGPPKNTSVIIYDNGEGQHPSDFDNTFLSLVRGNKNKIMFVQGKYNMGGSGAIVFCGKKGFQLIASKKHDNTGEFGFTLVREHPLTKDETENTKNTWYEYLKMGKTKIPSFRLSGELDLKLHNRKFKTGSIIKMYSYQFPSGYSGFAQDLNQSFNEFLFEPVLPVLTVDKKERYPLNKVLELDLFGLKRRLENDKDYVEDYFTETYIDELFGEMKVSCYVFKPKVKDNDVKKTKENIRSRFFKNNMSVMYSINGQAHGHYTSEFITRTLKFNLLKDYLLIHVDCTKMKYEFRKELFMASRDRLKEGEESRLLRDYLGKRLRKSKLDDINRHRKDSIGLDSEDTNELLKSFAKNLPKDSDLFKLLQNTMKLEEKTDKPAPKPEKNKNRPKEDLQPFNPKRFPSFFNLHNNKQEEKSVISIPLEGEKLIKFDTDVENEYFDRTDEPGNLEFSLLSVKRNESGGGGDKPGDNVDIGSLLNITKRSPNQGSIKLSVSPAQEMKVRDEVEIKVSLTGTGESFEQILQIKIKDKDAPKIETPKEEDSFENIGLPEMIRVKEDQWQELEAAGVSMDHTKVMYPQGDGNTLDKIYINLDSTVFLSNRKNLKSVDQIQTAEKRYLASIYFHTLFLYMITKKKNYKLQQEGNDNEVSVDEYLADVFDSYYSDFLLNFGMEQLINSLED